ncbi:MAG: hypothetical protein ACXVAY_01395 [Mucilaginibacter sp.]
MNIEQKAAATLLDKGIKVPVTAPLLFRLFGKQQINITIGHPYLGTLYRISELCASSGIDSDLLEGIDEMNAHDLYRVHGKVMARIAAYAWLNANRRGSLLAGIVSGWFYWHLKPIQLKTLVEVLIVLSNASHFRNTIRSVSTMTMMKPNLSQEAQGS